MSEKLINLENLKEYNKQMKETYIEPLENKVNDISSDLLDVEAQQIPCVKGEGAPTGATEGIVGHLYMDTAAGKFYRCTSASSGTYVWEEFGQAKGEPGVIFTPHVAADGTLSWTNDGGLSNPTPVNIVGNVESIGEIVQVTGNSETAVMSQKATTDAIERRKGTADTKVTLTVTDRYLLDIRALYRLENHGGCTSVDWGDGVITPIVGTTDDEMKHTYTTAGTYTITLTNVTDLPLIFRGKNVSKLEIGSTVERIVDWAFNENPSLTEVTMYAQTPPVTYRNSGSGVIKPFDDTVKAIYVHNNSYLTSDSWSYYADRMYSDFLTGEVGVSDEVQAQINQNTADIAELKENIVVENYADTKVTLTVTDGYYLDIRAIYRLDDHGGCTSVDWGDGIVTEIVGKTDDEMKHTYTVGGTYTITLVGIKVLPRAFVNKNVSYVIIGSAVETIDDTAFWENPNLLEATIYAINPPTLIDTSSARNMPFDVQIKTIYVPDKSLRKYVDQWSEYASIFQTDSILTNIFADKVITVGASGDFPTINKAIEYLSAFYPVYKKGGIKCEIRILDGTVIDEQIIVERLDLSYITITTDNANNTVAVTPTTANWSKGTLTHDTRGNVPFFGGEFGARLPVIKCLFSATSPTVTLDGSAIGIVGYYCNRGSMGVIAGETTYAGSNSDTLENVGFEGFYDNIIANNNSEIVLREAIARNAERYGVMSRHISRVSARSADITGCKECAAYVDRASMMDVRYANLSSSKNAIQSYNASVMTANETIANNITGLVADSQAGSILNAESIDAQNSANIFSVSMGGQIVAKNAKTTGATGTIYNVAANTLTADGIIFN